MQSPCNKANTIMTPKKKKIIIPTFLDIEWVLCVGSFMCMDGHTPSVERLSLLDTWTQAIFCHYQSWNLNQTQNISGYHCTLRVCLDTVYIY